MRNASPFTGSTLMSFCRIRSTMFSMTPVLRSSDLLDAAGHRRSDVAFWNPLGHDENDGFRPVQIGREARLDRRDARNDDERQNDQPLPAPRDIEKVFRGVLLAGDHASASLM